MAVRSCFSCEWQNPHFQSQVLAPIMHWCQPHPIMFRAVSRLSLGGPASPLRNKLLTKLRATAHLAAARALALGWL